MPFFNILAGEIKKKTDPAARQAKAIPKRPLPSRSETGKSQAQLLAEKKALAEREAARTRARR